MVACSLIPRPSLKEKRSGEPSRISWASAHFCDSVTFIRKSKIVVQEMYGLVHISDFESIKCGKVQSNPNLLYGNYSCQPDPHMWSDHHGQVQVHNFSFNNVTNMDYNLISIVLKILVHS